MINGRPRYEPEFRLSVKEQIVLSGRALPPRPHWAEPKLVTEVRFVEWTRGRHVRHPSFLGLRYDKKPRDVVLDPRAGTAL